MGPSWNDFLRGARAGHAVQIYANADDLADSVAAFLATGLAQGEPAVVVATPENAARFRAGLAERGADTTQVEALCVHADARETTLAILGSGSLPSPVDFERIVGGLIDGAGALAPGRRVRVFGEMVDVLAAEGNIAAAVALEELWSTLAERRDFSLLCGYRLDVFDSETQLGILPEVCRTHSHVLPARNYPRLAGAVDRALNEVLGREEADRIYQRLAGQPEGESVPMAQRILMWISENRPMSSRRILATARSHYGSPR